MKKRLFAVLFSVLLFWCFTVTAFAAVSLPYVWIEDGISHIGVFPISSQSDEVKQVWNDMFSSNYRYILVSNKISGSLSNLNVRFFFLSPDSSVSYTETTGSNGKQLSVTLTNARTMLFSYSSGSFSFLSLDSVVKPTVNFSVDFFLGGSHSSINSLPSFVDTYRPNVTQQYVIVDDLPDPDPPSSSSSSEPEPPVNPPSRPEPSQPPLDYPTFPKVDGIYITYDTTIWNKFAFDVRGSIGSSTNIGLIIFAILASILVLLRVIRSFSGTDTKHKDVEEMD